MTKREELKQLQIRKVALLSIMASSDAHAAKCIKLGKKFQTQYPEEHEAYCAANAEYQEVEQQINNLEFELSVEDGNDTNEGSGNEVESINADNGGESVNETEKPASEETEGE